MQLTTRMSVDKVKTGIVAVLILTSVLVSGCLREYDTTNLFINKVDITADIIDDDSARLDIITYVSNRGTTSGEVEIQAKAYNLDTGLLMDDEKMSMGRVGKDKTLNITVPLTVPITGNYRIEVSMYEDGGQRMSGEATISGLESLLTQPKHSYINIRDVDVAMLLRSETKTTLKVTIFLDNYGRSDSAPLTAMVKLKDAKSNLIGNDGIINVGVVKADTTVIKDIELEVPKDRDYRVELLIFENDRIIAEYGVSFFLAPGSTGAEEVVKRTESVSTTKTITSEFTLPTPLAGDIYSTGEGPFATETPGFGILGAMLGFGIVVILIGRGNKKR